jgi:hypothetical protein
MVCSGYVDVDSLRKLRYSSTSVARMASLVTDGQCLSEDALVTPFAILDAECPVFIVVGVS